MKLRFIILGATVIALCSSSAALAGEVVRAAKARPVAKSSLKVSRAAARLQDANKDGSTIPIVVAAVAAGGAAIYFATKSDTNASQ